LRSQHSRLPGALKSHCSPSSTNPFPQFDFLASLGGNDDDLFSNVVGDFKEEDILDDIDIDCVGSGNDKSKEIIPFVL
jgi:hypothetical protein